MQALVEAAGKAVAAAQSGKPGAEWTGASCGTAPKANRKSVFARSVSHGFQVSRGAPRLRGGCHNTAPMAWVRPAHR
jgi:hypothetical protein